MARLASIQNGVSGRRRKRRNPVTKSATPKRRSNPLTKARVTAFAKKNGLKLVSKSVSNPRKRKRRRNGIVTKSAVTRSSRNGLLGKTKHDARQVGAVLAGAVVTKLVGRVVSGVASPYLSQIGVGNYSELISDLAVALVVVPMVAKKVSSRDADNARLGGLLAVGLDAIDQFGGSALSGLNPFTSNPVVVVNGQPAVTTQAVKQLVNNTTATPAEKAAVTGAMNAIESGARVASGGAVPNVLWNGDLG